MKNEILNSGNSSCMCGNKIAEDLHKVIHNNKSGRENIKTTATVEFIKDFPKPDAIAKYT